MEANCSNSGRLEHKLKPYKVLTIVNLGIALMMTALHLLLSLLIQQFFNSDPMETDGPATFAVIMMFFAIEIAVAILLLIPMIIVIYKTIKLSSSNILGLKNKWFAVAMLGIIIEITTLICQL